MFLLIGWLPMSAWPCLSSTHVCLRLMSVSSNASTVSKYSKFVQYRADANECARTHIRNSFELEAAETATAVGAPPTTRPLQGGVSEICEREVWFKHSTSKNIRSRDAAASWVLVGGNGKAGSEGLRARTFIGNLGRGGGKIGWGGVTGADGVAYAMADGAMVSPSKGPTLFDTSQSSREPDVLLHGAGNVFGHVRDRHVRDVYKSSNSAGALAFDYSHSKYASSSSQVRSPEMISVH